MLLELYWTFVKVGFTSFGGTSMIPLISQEMLSHEWMTAEDFSNIIAIAEMTPGPFGVNCATFAGMQVAGILGGIIAVLGVLLPAFTLTIFVAACFSKFKTSQTFNGILVVIRPACIGMIIAVIISLLQTNYLVGGTINLYTLGIGALALLLLMKYKWSVPKVIICSAILGIICIGVL
ncbi:MAG: chromate transporter [Lachnospiraceae bacterium]|nr:chromate transporter [Lachnospiraceae bacterium]